MAGSLLRTSTFQQLIDEKVLEIGDGYRAKNEELGGSGPLFLRAGHVTDTHIDFVGVERFHASLSGKLKAKMARVGDTIITTKGNSTGRTSFVAATMPEFVYSPHLSYWRTLDETALASGFLRYWARSSEFTRQLSGMKASTDMAPYLSLTDQRRLKITLLPPDEQRAIACILGALDEKIELNRRRNRTLEAMARAIFQSWFVDFVPVKAKAAGRTPSGLKPELADLFPDAFEDSALGPIPKGWRVGRVRELCVRVENGGTPKRKCEEFWNPAEVPWLTSGEVRQQFIIGTESYISNSGLENSSAKIWPPFTTVVALYGATAGIATMLGMELCANQACCGLLPTDASACFVHQVLSRSLSNLQQQARGSAQQNLSQSIVADFEVVLPPALLLAEFERRVRPIYESCIAGLTQSRTLAALRDTLLPKLISGELRVPDAERIVGRVA